MFDAAALILSEEGAKHLASHAAARNFVADAFAHCKFIGLTAGAPLLRKVDVEPDMDEGLVALDAATSTHVAGATTTSEPPDPWECMTFPKASQPAA